MSDYQETNVITSVNESKDWYEISQGGMGCGLKKSYGIKPKVGDLLTVHTKGGVFGTIRGMDLNGEPVFWKTDEQLEQERVDWLANYQKQKEERFEQEREQMDADYEALPESFKKRIGKLRANNPTFRVDYEGYELFCCMEAVKIANYCQTPEAVERFRKLPYDEQKANAGIDDGHSGNTLGCAVTLAYTYLKEQQNLSKVLGALSPLVGSEAYGDFSRPN